jgi:hypothetical protein
MSGLGVRPVHRVKGKPALVRSLRGLIIRAHRYAQHRATTPADQVWAAALIDGLFAVLAAANPRDDTRRAP